MSTTVRWLTAVDEHQATDAYAKVEEIVYGRIKKRCFGIETAKPDQVDVEPGPAPRRVLARLFHRRKGA